MEKRKMILNIGCGGRPEDRATTIGDVRLDSEKLPSVTIVADAHNMPFRGNVFGTIVCFEVLEHLDSPIKALREFRRVLKEEGRVVITVPNVWYWRRIFRTLLKGHGVLEKTPHANHKQAWDIYDFHRLAYQAEFRVIKVKWLDWYPKGKLKLGSLDRILWFIPQVCFTHTMFKLRAITKPELG